MCRRPEERYSSGGGQPSSPVEQYVYVHAWTAKTRAPAGTNQPSMICQRHTDTQRDMHPRFSPKLAQIGCRRMQHTITDQRANDPGHALDSEVPQIAGQCPAIQPCLSKPGNCRAGSWMMFTSEA
jgi:hypothetical protein